MARNRVLNPDFWLDEDLAVISAHSRLLYMGLWGICDDRHATLPDRPDWIKIQIFPYEEVNVRELLSELEKVGKIIRFMSDGKHFWFIKNFKKHQKIDHPSLPKYPPYEIKMGVLVESSESPRSKKEIKLIKEEKISTGNPQNPQQLRKIDEIMEIARKGKIQKK